MGYHITFASAHTASDRSVDLKKIGVTTQSIQVNDAGFDEFIRQLNPAMVVFDRFITEEQFGWRVAEQTPQALRILDTEDLHFLRKARIASLKKHCPADTSMLMNDIAKRELACMYRSDMSLIISEYEMQLLKEVFRFPESLLWYLPFLLEPLTETENLPEYEERAHFITIGNFLHEPNADAVHYLKGSIWPAIRNALPEAEMHIYGAYESAAIGQLNNKRDGFFIRGYTPDAHEVMKRARICLAPLRAGAGLKGKLIDAMINGTPCIMTAIAAEGMFGFMNPNGEIEDTPELFAAKAISLYRDASRWKTFQLNGFNIINNRFQRNRFANDFTNRIKYLLENLENLRQKNFTGSMLLHHTLQSNKYMSKWIEAKNKLKSE